MSKLIGNKSLKHILINFEIDPQSDYEKPLVRMQEMLVEKGYLNYMCGLNAKGENGKIYLPVNTLCKYNSSPAEAKNELREVARFCGASLTACIACEVLEWSGISGKAPVAAQKERIA